MRLLLILAVGLGVLTFCATYDRPDKAVIDFVYDKTCSDDSDKCPNPLWSAKYRVDSGIYYPELTVYIVAPETETREGRALYIVGRRKLYCEEATQLVIPVPEGFETDFASIPAFASSWFRPDNTRFMSAAVIHDWLYAASPAGDADAKRRADDFFLQELKLYKVNFIRRRLMYYAVSVFGGKNFGGAEELRFRNIETDEVTIHRRPDQLEMGRANVSCEEFRDYYGNYYNASLTFIERMKADTRIEDNPDIF